MFLLAMLQSIIGIFMILLIVPVPVLKSLFCLFLIGIATEVLLAGFKGQRDK
jgi:hypothetical protein